MTRGSMEKRSKRRRLARAGAIALASIGLVWLVLGSGFGFGTKKTWLSIEHRDLVLGIATEGELRAIDSALIGPPQLHRMWNFRISMIAPEGSEVQAGQPVLGFDTTETHTLETSGQSLRRVFRTRVRLDDLDLERMRPGMSVKVIVEDRRDDVLMVPRAALGWSEGESGSAVVAARSDGVRGQTPTARCGS